MLSTKQKTILIGVLIAVLVASVVGVVLAATVFNIQNSNPATYTVDPTPTTVPTASPSPTPDPVVDVAVSLTPSATHGQPGAPVTLTATVTNPGVVGRILHFYDGPLDVGNAPIQNVGGVYQAVLTIAPTQVRAHTYVAADPDQ